MTCGMHGLEEHSRRHSAGGLVKQVIGVGDDAKLAAVFTGLAGEAAVGLGDSLAVDFFGSSLEDLDGAGTSGLVTGFGAGGAGVC